MRLLGLSTIATLALTLPGTSAPLPKGRAGV